VTYAICPGCAGKKHQLRELEFLHYHPGSGLWHTHDPRLKLLELCLWSILALTAPNIVLALIIPELLILLGISDVRIRRMKKPLLFWTLMAAAIIIFSWLSLGTPGIMTGVMRSLRLLAVLLASQLLIATTDPGDFADTIRSLLGFLPASFTGALATAMSLTISFIPGILDVGINVRDTAMSRGLGLRKSIFRRALSLAMPMAAATLRRAHITCDALLSRAYTDNPTPAGLRIRPVDIGLFLAVILPPILATILANLIALSPPNP